MTVAILASGQSLKGNSVDFVKKARYEGRLKAVIAVSNVGLDLAPWADALVSHDTKWWASNLHSNNFLGRKFCRNRWPKCEVFIPSPSNGCNSGYMAMQVARDIFKAQRIILLGFDMHGTHYFGPHPKGLRNTTEDRFKVHISQFDGWYGPQVINCTPDSSLRKFPFIDLEKVL